MTNERSPPVPNGAEIIDFGASSDDLGEHVPRAAKSSSPDPILLSPNAVHIFATHPTEYSPSSSNYGQGRARKLAERVESSEEDETIEEFMFPPRIARPSIAKKPQKIPTCMDIVLSRRMYWENLYASAPAAGRQLAEKGVNPADLTIGTVIKRRQR